MKFNPGQAQQNFTSMISLLLTLKSFLQLVTDAKEALWGLFREHVVIPVKNIWNVIRYDNNEVRDAVNDYVRPRKCD